MCTTCAVHSRNCHTIIRLLPEPLKLAASIYSCSANTVKLTLLHWCTTVLVCVVACEHLTVATAHCGELKHCVAMQLMVRGMLMLHRELSLAVKLASGVKWYVFQMIMTWYYLHDKATS
jgi:hypothetical protein